MHFASPHLLWLLPVLPGALLAFLWWSWKRRQALRSQFVQSRLLASLVAGFSPARQKFRMACLVAAVACLVLALARPQWGFSWQEVKQRGLDIVVAIDTSKSMLATDIAPNRLERAKLAALDLMQEAKFDRLGVVAFAGTAFLQCPLTIDDAAFRQSVDSLDVNIIPQGGTAIAEAIDVALTAFTEGDNYKALVLITDGEDQDSGALEAAKKAAAAGMRIYTVGVGTPEGELLRLKKPDGSTDYVRDEQGNVVKSHLNEALLQQIAGETDGGFYLPLRGAKTMETLYREGPSRLPKTEHQEKFVRQYHERYHWPLALAILLLLLEQLIPERRRESARAPITAASAKKAAATAAVVACVALPCWPAAASPSGALRDYKRGNYDRAFEQYEQSLKKNGDDPRLHFNAGAAAYQDGRFEEAAKQFNQSLSSQDLRLQQMSYYNRGNAQYQLGERAPDPKQRMDLWQKSLQDFTSSLKLNPQDADARFNQEFVKKRLEELKQQQQQQSQQDKSDQQKQDQNQQQQPQSQQDQNQQKQQQQQEQQQQQGDQKQASQQQQQDHQQAKSEAQQNQGKEQPQPQPQQAKKEESKDQQQAAGGKEEQKQEGETAAAAGQMTAEQARQLLDSDKGDEQLLQFKPEGKPREPNRHIRDW